jgi:uncharacterized protein YcbK (DUF882 family)
MAMSDSNFASAFTRRQFLATAVCSAASLAIARPSLASAYGQRSVALINTHTGDELTAVYFKNGIYDSVAMVRVASLLRDHRSGDVHGIDPLLLDTLFELQVRNEHDKPYQVVSAYRSPLTNARLKHETGGVATNSMHMQGRAIDIRVAGVPTKKLRDHALSMGRGGVGYYASANFLHIDTGRVRSW